MMLITEGEQTMKQSKQKLSPERASHFNRF